MSDMALNECAGRAADIMAYLHVELDPATRAELEQHIEACRACAAELRDQQWVLHLIRLAFSDELTPERESSSRRAL